MHLRKILKIRPFKIEYENDLSLFITISPIHVRKLTLHSLDLNANTFLQGRIFQDIFST